jgi:uncharacterized protein YkwD
MKMNALQLFLINHKVTAFALGAMLTTIVGTSVSRAMPADNAKQDNTPESQSTITSVNLESETSLMIPATESTPEYQIQDTVPSTESVPTDTVVSDTVPPETTEPVVTETQKTTTKPTTVSTTGTTTPTTAAPTQTTAPASSGLGDESGTYDSSKEQAVLALVNEQRTNAGLAALTWSDTLAGSARIRATEIVVKWSHTRPDGSAWYTAGAQMQTGENLAYGQTSSEQVMNEWMASIGHQENILRTSFTKIGIAAYYCNGVYYWVQHFA